MVKCCLACLPKEPLQTLTEVKLLSSLSLSGSWLIQRFRHRTRTRTNNCSLASSVQGLLHCLALPCRWIHALYIHKLMRTRNICIYFRPLLLRSRSDSCTYIGIRESMQNETLEVLVSGFWNSVGRLSLILLLASSFLSMARASEFSLLYVD